MHSTAAVLCLVVAAVYLVSALSICPFPVSCLCGNTGLNYTYCKTNLYADDDICHRLSRCIECQEGVTECLQCPSGFTGPTCSIEEVEEASSRSKRQLRRPSHRRRPSFQALSMSGRLVSCPEMPSPKFGSIRCMHTSSARTCRGKCLPGYTFQDSESDEMTLTCRQGVWEPLAAFPPCESGGHCELELNGMGGGAFNCTTGMRGTRCDVSCSGRSQGRFFCNPGRDWEPALPFCIRAKGPQISGTPSCRCQNGGVCGDNGACVCPDGRTGVYCELASPSESRVRCLCESGGSCDAFGRCVCPAGRTGMFCERVDPQRVYCRDPGFILDGYRMRIDGSRLDRITDFQGGDYIVYSCNQRNYALEGASILTCNLNGSWSAEVPRCVRPGVTCPDPGIVRNADRLNTDGSSSRTPSTYEPGQSVVYTCRRGFALHGVSLLTCRPTGTWSNDLPFCSAVGRPPVATTTTTTENPLSNSAFCPNPGVIPNGAWMSFPPAASQRTLPQNTQIHYSCNDGYRLQGEENIFCLFGGVWSAELPTCVSNSPRSDNDLMYCDNPGALSNGQVVIQPPLNERTLNPPTQEDQDLQDLPEGTRLLYSCEEGYTLRGSVSITCENTGYWTELPPICVGECGKSGMQTTRRITYGEPTVAGEWPWTVAIAERKNNVASVICGGALIDRRTVVTAAHCFDSGETFELYIGKYRRKMTEDDEKVQRRTSISLKIHPNYNRSNFESDIALVRFTPNVKYDDRIQAICLPTPETTAKNIILGKGGYLTGWGETEKQLPSDAMLMAYLPVVPINECIEAFARQRMVLPTTHNTFCAGYEKGQTSACAGDSGSPMVFYDKTQQRQTLEGIVSFGVRQECGMPGKYVVFTKVLPYMPWILRNMS